VIFVTVGTQLAFDRMVCAVDGWAALHPDEAVFAQIGPATALPLHMQHERFLSPARADELMRSAEVIVAHAGMGSVLTALALQRPIIIVPRRADRGEHRNDHQLATARWLQRRPGVFVAWDETEVGGLLDDRRRLNGAEPISPFASGPLVERLARVISQSVQGP
jgi:UDP-N-acetylglucosamine transferase subunit ALG13